ncbi:MAG: tetratricopeptide (TPR) repeat protein, partial [Kiritimatiellia bacterium]
RRFRREFRALSRLSHTNVLQVREWGLYGDRPWYTMELIPGRTLREEVPTWLTLSPPERFSRVQGVLVQVVRALDYIHLRGLVHRDLTPGNVMVQPDGVVKLMDFGVVKELGSDMTGVTEIMGTVAWISPEQIRSDVVDSRADLYSLGAVLYFMLTGKRPFQATTLQGWLDKHLHETPRSPREHQPLVPESLSQICMRLMAKEPSARFASASHLLHVLGDRESIDDAEHWPARVVGRTRIRAQIRESINLVLSHDRGSALLLRGGVGQGKSRLIDLAEQQAKRRGLRVARGRARPDDAPFGSFIGVLDALDPDRHADEILRTAMLGEGNAKSRERYPVLAAFKKLIVSCAPVMILLDDAHYADGASLDLLEYLIRNTVELSFEAVSYIVSEDAAPGGSALHSRLQSIHTVQIEHLGPLERSEVEELVLSVVPDSATTRALATRLHAESDGSPAYLADMLHGLVDEGVLVQDQNGYRLTIDLSEITRSRLPMPASLRQVLQDRLTPISEESLIVARALAIARRRLALDDLVAATPLDEPIVMESLDDLIEAGIVTESRTDEAELVELSHQRFRDVLLESLSQEERRAGHQRMGEVLELHHRRKPGLVTEELTYHFEQAGLPPKAYAYLVRTAQRRLDASLWEEALSFLDRALRMEATARPMMLLEAADRTLTEVLLSRSQCLMALGQWDEAHTNAHRAAEIAELVRDPHLQSRILAEIGQQLRSHGTNRKAEPWLREALEKAEISNDPSLLTGPMYQLGAILWAKGNLDEAEKMWRGSLQTAQRVHDERAMGFGYNGLGILSFCTGQSMEARRHLERSAELFEGLGMLAPLAIARVNLAELYHATGILKKALALAERTVAQAREVHHPLGTALGLAQRARVLTTMMRLDEAMQSSTEAVRITRDMHAGEDEVVAQLTLVDLYMERNDWQQASAEVKHLETLLPDYDTEGIAPYVFARSATIEAHRGNSKLARRELDRALRDPPDWPHIQVRTSLACAEAQLALNCPTEAQLTLQKALSVAESSGYRYYQLVAHQGLAGVT